MTASYRECVQCCIDTSVPGTSFDGAGVCSYCHLHDVMEREFPNGARGEEVLRATATRIRNAGSGKPFDCVVGISGGRDSSYTLHFVVRQLGLRPLAVHFNDGFGNPVAGENMRRITAKLSVSLRTISSDWRESKDLRIALLKASTPDLGLSTDIGIATALYGTAVQERLKHVVIGQSFRTEGIAPLEWNFLDGRYLKTISAQFGRLQIRPWRPENPGFNLGLLQLGYYAVVRRIRTVFPLYHIDYVRRDVDKLLFSEYGWTNPGAHYMDDLYQALINYVLRRKFGIDRRRFNFAALIRSGQMDRDRALKLLEQPSPIGDDLEVLRLCIKRLGLTWDEFEAILNSPPKTFHNYQTNFNLLRRLRRVIQLLSNFNLVPRSSYLKYCTEGDEWERRNRSA